METKLFDSELKLMEIIWREGDLTAKKIAEFAKDEIGWGKTTTYTVIKKCIDKGAVERQDPNFVCHSLVSKEEVQDFETEELINKIYGGSSDQLVANLLGVKELKPKKIERLRKLVQFLEEDE